MSLFPNTFLSSLLKEFTRLRTEPRNQRRNEIFVLCAWLDSASAKLGVNWGAIGTASKLSSLRGITIICLLVPRAGSCGCSPRANLSALVARESTREITVRGAAPRPQQERQRRTPADDVHAADSMGEGPGGRYVIVRHLATGGYGSVFEVREPAPHCPPLVQPCSTWRAGRCRAPSALSSLYAYAPPMTQTSPLAIASSRPLFTQAHDTVSNTRVAIKKSTLFSDENDPNDQGIPVPCPLRQHARTYTKIAQRPKGNAAAHKRINSNVAKLNQTKPN